MTTTPMQKSPTFVTGLFMSLDGIVEADETWQFAYFDAELFTAVAASWERAGAVLMGRHSFAGYDRLRHEHPESPAIQFLDSVPKYVASTVLTEVEWPGTSILGADLESDLTRLRTERDTDVLVLGSPTLVRWMLARRLLDSLAFTILPIVVGSGARLFEDMDLPTGHLGMRLVAVRRFTSGAVELHYTFA